jgi:VanZ family protein
MSSYTHKDLEPPARFWRTLWWRFLLVVVYLGAIFALSSIPGEQLPGIGVSDKLLHAVEFGGLVILLCRMLRVWAPTQSLGRIACMSILVAICYGAIDEIHQSMVAHRVADVADLVADTLGALLAAWGWLWAGTRWPWVQ